MDTQPSREEEIVSLVEAHQRGVFRYLRLIGCAPDRIEDIVQQTFLAVIERPIEDYNRAATAQYLRKVARNFFLKSLRHSSREFSMDSLEETERTFERYVDDEDPDRHLEAIRKCLESLDERPRRALEMQHRDGLSRIETANALGVSDSGVKTMIQRARKILRRCVEERLGL